jgi:hypothetical protein
MSYTPSLASPYLFNEEKKELAGLTQLGTNMTPAQQTRYNILTKRSEGQRLPTQRMQQLLQVIPHPENKGLGRSSLSYSTARRIREALEKDSYNKKEPGWELARAIGPRNLGISFNPYLTTEETARRWLQKKQADDEKYGTDNYRGWKIETEDLDSNPRTPDDVLVLDSRGNPKIVSGYALNSGKGRRNASIFYNQYPDKRQAAAVRKELKQAQQTRLLNKWMAEQGENATSITPYGQEWMEEAISKRPKLNPAYYRDDRNKHPFNLLRSIVFRTLKENGKSMDPMFFYIAQDTLSHVYEILKESNNGNKNGMRDDLLTKTDTTKNIILQIYEQLRPSIQAHHLQNVAPLWRGFSDDTVIKEEGTIPTGFPPGANIFSSQESK